ncbi:MAG TPA: hypothetical protein VJ875_20540 [Pyrinomonadaceae bacterium]|nr:hypothetical protein [Pyrinomonadaceae bacterium]
MNNTGQNGEKMRYRVILLLVVGLAAFSSAMKELNQLQQLALDAHGLIAQWSNKVAPAEVQPAVVKVEKTCEMKQSAPAVELPWLAEARPAASVEMSMIEPARLVTARRAHSSTTPISTFRRLRLLDVDPVQFEVKVLNNHDADANETLISDFPQNLLKTKNRKHNVIRISPRDREMLLKLNRSINLRIAS